MFARRLLIGIIIVFNVVLVDVGQARSDESNDKRAEPDSQIHQAVERGLAFLEQDVVKWRKELKCSTCHHGTMTVWVYGEAKRQGYAIKPETAVETIEWAKKRFMDRIDNPRDKRPGWSMVSTPAIYLALMAQFVDKQDAVSDDEMKRIGDHLIRHQEPDGSWVWSSAPPINRPPPFFESDEVATRLAYMALSSHVAADKTKTSDSRDKAIAWLEKSKPSDTTQAAALRLLMKDRASDAGNWIEPDVVSFLKRQNNDGGWGQLDDLPSDAYATGQALYVLSLMGVKHERPEVQRAVTFLVANQREDGSWPMKSRAHPGVEPYKNPMPITYFGSAWATLGLMRSVGRATTYENGE